LDCAWTGTQSRTPDLRDIPSVDDLRARP
jgi:hypothetical protein